MTDLHTDGSGYKLPEILGETTAFSPAPSDESMLQPPVLLEEYLKEKEYALGAPRPVKAQPGAHHVRHAVLSGQDRQRIHARASIETITTLLKDEDKPGSQNPFVPLYAQAYALAYWGVVPDFHIHNVKYDPYEHSLRLVNQEECLDEHNQNDPDNIRHRLDVLLYQFSSGFKVDFPSAYFRHFEGKSAADFDKIGPEHLTELVPEADRQLVIDYQNRYHQLKHYLGLARNQVSPHESSEIRLDIVGRTLPAKKTKFILEQPTNVLKNISLENRINGQDHTQTP